MHLRAARQLSLAAACLATTLGLAAAPASGFTPPTKACGSFVARHVRYRIKRNAAGVSCQTARRVMRQFFTGSKRIHHSGGLTDSAHTYYTLPGQPGWGCGFGAGDGPAGSAVCSKAQAAVGGDGFPT